MNAVVTISRYWNNPKITTCVSGAGISVEIGLEDFLEGLAREMGPVAWVVTDRQFRGRLAKAAEVVVEKAKEETIKVVSQGICAGQLQEAQPEGR